MKKQIIIKSNQNTGQGILKPLSFLIDNGADISFQEIEKYQKKYREEGEVIISGSLESIEKSSQEFDDKGIVYELLQ